MTEKEQLALIYEIWHFPPQTDMEADRNFVWQLLLVGCPPRYILMAYQEVLAKFHFDDAYEDDKNGI